MTHFRWLPNTLTILRAILAILLLIAAVKHEWPLVFGLFVLALFTDFLDGLAAKKLNAATKLGGILDPLTDGLLCACGLVALVLTHHLSWAIFLIMALSAVDIGYIKFFRNDKPRWQRLTQTFSVAYLFAIWLSLALAYAALAWGWHWWYLLFGAVLLVGAALLKRHRLRAWYGWVFVKFRENFIK